MAHRILQRSGAVSRCIQCGRTHRAKVAVPAQMQTRSFFKEFAEKLKENVKENKELQESLDKLQKKAQTSTDYLQNAKEEAMKSDTLKKSTESFQKTSDTLQKSSSSLREKFSEYMESFVKKDGKTTAKQDTTTEKSATPESPKETLDMAAEVKDTTDNVKASSSEQAEVKEDVKEKTKSPSTADEPGPVTKLLQFFGFLRTELIDTSDHAKRAAPYVSPVDRSRKSKVKQRVIAENPDVQSVVVKNDSEWSSQWLNFKNNNPVLDRLFGLKMQFDESDNIVIRATRYVTDTVSQKLSGVFDEGDMSKTIAEIHRLDPSFEPDKFTLYCESQVIPSVLEAYLSGDVEALKDWCSEPCYNVLSQHIEQRNHAGMKVESRILDIRNVDILMGKVMDEGPVLIMTFIAQQVRCVRDRSGAIVEGAEDQIEKVLYVFAMRRDQTVYHPELAWQLLELGEQHAVQNW